MDMRGVVLKNIFNVDSVIRQKTFSCGDLVFVGS